MNHPWAAKKVDAPPAPMAELIEAAIDAAREEGKALGAYRVNSGPRRAIDVTARKAIEASNAVYARLRQIAPEELR